MSLKDYIPERKFHEYKERIRKRKPNLPVQNTISSTVVAVLETSSELAEIPKNIRNYGRPPEDFGIDIVTETRPLSDIMPECAESTKDLGVWFFNGPAIEQLINNWVQIPSEEQFLAHVNAISGDAEAKARIMNPEGEPFPGLHGAGVGEVFGRFGGIYWWVVLSDGSGRCVYLQRGDQDASSSATDLRNGFLVPFFRNNK